MAALPNRRWTAEEYLAFERTSEEKHEYLAGEVYLMTGASRNHNLITANLITTLSVQLRGRQCEVYASDMRVSAADSYTYPDVTVVCGQPKFEDDEVDTLLNPIVIIEVLSPSTENYDRGKKFQHYRALSSLQEYLLVSQDTPRIEYYTRHTGDQWLFSDVTGLDSQLELPSINCAMKLADVYDKVAFDED
jgi:Uma2 family endonuclease